MEEKIYEIDFRGNVKALIKVKNGELVIDKAVDGWGNLLTSEDIKITVH